jgi:hypothetical protein
MTIFESVGGFRARRIGEQQNARISIGYRIVGTIYIATDAVEDQSAQTGKSLARKHGLVYLAEILCNGIIRSDFQKLLPLNPPRSLG